MEFPPKGFRVGISVSSIERSPEYIEGVLGLKATEKRPVKDEARKYNTWRLEADWSIGTIQEQVDDVLSRVGGHAEKFRILQDCDIVLTVYLYPEFKDHHPESHPSFCISEEQIALLQSMNASFVID